MLFVFFHSVIYPVVLFRYLRENHWYFGVYYVHAARRLWWFAPGLRPYAPIKSTSIRRGDSERFPIGDVFAPLASVRVGERFLSLPGYAVKKSGIHPWGGSRFFIFIPILCFPSAGRPHGFGPLGRVNLLRASPTAPTRAATEGQRPGESGMASGDTHGHRPSWSVGPTARSDQKEKFP